jgi:hypothetical protein
MEEYVVGLSHEERIAMGALFYGTRALVGALGILRR